MANNDKICMQLEFNRSISYSQRIKVKNFWKFLEDTKALEPYEVKSEKEIVKETPKLPICKRKWYRQLKIFQENGLGEVALAAGEKCKLCYDHSRHMSLEFPDTVEESYDNLLIDMMDFDKRSDDKTKRLTSA
ncbi:unnamed protein product [Xylocopa violacea]|uniref:Uncharacterized protein n=1 Tax=Xylocopa violacea TaxID=135666 RepID=A0ABP1PB82_XYLVO